MLDDSSSAAVVPTVAVQPRRVFSWARRISSTAGAFVRNTTYALTIVRHGFTEQILGITSRKDLVLPHRVDSSNKRRAIVAPPNSLPALPPPTRRKRLAATTYSTLPRGVRHRKEDMSDEKNEIEDVPLTKSTSALASSKASLAALSERLRVVSQPVPPPGDYWKQHQDRLARTIEYEEQRSPPSRQTRDTQSRFLQWANKNQARDEESLSSASSAGHNLQDSIDSNEGQTASPPTSYEYGSVEYDEKQAPIDIGMPPETTPEKRVRFYKENQAGRSYGGELGSSIYLDKQTSSLEDNPFSTSQAVKPSTLPRNFRQLHTSHNLTQFQDRLQDDGKGSSVTKSAQSGQAHHGRGNYVRTQELHHASQSGTSQEADNLGDVEEDGSDKRVDFLRSIFASVELENKDTKYDLEDPVAGKVIASMQESMRLRKLERERQKREAEELHKQEMEMRELEEKRRKEVEAEQERLQKEEERKALEKLAEEKAAQEEKQRLEAEAKERKEKEQARRLKHLREKDEEKDSQIKLESAGMIVVPITDLWKTKIQQVIRGEGRHQFPGNLTRRDILSLNPSTWLNDEVINSWMKHVCDTGNTQRGWTAKSNEPPPFVPYSSHWYTTVNGAKGVSAVARWGRRFKFASGGLLKTEIVLFPINLNNHWTLLVVYPSERRIEYMDSFGGAGRPIISKVREWLQMELGSLYKAADWNDCLIGESPDQTNGFDCGAFVCFNGLSRVRGVEPRDAYSQEDLTEGRVQIASVLMNNGFTGDFEWAD